MLKHQECSKRALTDYLIEYDGVHKLTDTKGDEKMPSDTGLKIRRNAFCIPDGVTINADNKEAMIVRTQHS